MRKQLTFIKQKLSFLAAIILAAVVGGFTTTLVRAGVPDSNGQIHSCYSTSRGSMYVIDSSTQSCGAGESGLNWSQNANNGMPFTCPQCNLTFDVDYFEGKDLSNAYLPLVALSTLNLTGTNFTNAYLYSMGGSGTNFENTNFTNADLRYSDLTSSSFSNTNLTNADLSEASLYNSTDMDTATLTGVTWSNTRCPDGSYSNDHSNTCVGHLIP